MSERTTEIPLGGNLRMTLACDLAKPRYLAGVYRRRGSGVARAVTSVASAGAEHASLVLAGATAALWIGGTRFCVPRESVARIETFFQLRATRAKETTP